MADNVKRATAMVWIAIVGPGILFAIFMGYSMLHPDESKKKCEQAGGWYDSHGRYPSACWRKDGTRIFVNGEFEGAK